MRKYKRIISNMVAVAVVAVSALSAASVIKADTVRHTWAVNGRTGEVVLNDEALDTKDGSGPVAVAYNSGPYDISAGVFGCKTKNGTYINLTYPDHELSMVDMEVGDEVQIRNYLFSKFGPNFYVKVGFCLGGTGLYVGEWSPDCP